MSDKKPEPTEEVIEDAVVVDEVETAEPVEVDEVEEDVYVAPSQQVIYVQTPAAPSRKGNRGVGVAIAVASAVVFIAVLALITSLIGYATSGRFTFNFLADAQFYIPVLFFVVAFVILVLLVNRGAWWAYILGSAFVAIVVYFGSIGLGLLTNGLIAMTPDEAAAAYASQLLNPFIIVAALLAREVSLWTGSIIARRGRKVTVRNAEARDAWEREVAEKRAAYEPGASAASSSY
jgi:hypothetical protein